MGGKNSPDSRQLANVRLSLRTGKTRGPNPRTLRYGELAALEEEMNAIVMRMHTMAAARAQHRAAQRERRGSDALRALRGSGDAVEIGCPPESGGPPESGDAPRLNVSVTIVFGGPPSIAQ